MEEDTRLRCLHKINLAAVTFTAKRRLPHGSAAQSRCHKEPLPQIPRDPRMNLLVFADAQPETVARSGTNVACLPNLEAYRSMLLLPAASDKNVQHPYNFRERQDEWCLDSAARRKQFNLLFSIYEYIRAKKIQGFETALALYASATTTPRSTMVTNALIFYHLAPTRPGRLRSRLTTKSSFNGLQSLMDPLRSRLWSSDLLASFAPSQHSSVHLEQMTTYDRSFGCMIKRLSDLQGSGSFTEI